MTDEMGVRLRAEKRVSDMGKRLPYKVESTEAVEKVKPKCGDCWYLNHCDESDGCEGFEGRRVKEADE